MFRATVSKGSYDPAVEQSALEFDDRLTAAGNPIEHLALIHAAEVPPGAGKTLAQKASGQFYTPESIGRRLARHAAKLAADGRCTSIIDPFCGDGRLIEWFLEEAIAIGVGGLTTIGLQDCDADAVGLARARVEQACVRLGFSCHVEAWCGDSFLRGADAAHSVVITNPPWELVKPDRRELTRLGEDAADYVAALRSFDSFLIREYPDAQPSARFAGWGTNLSRVGSELALRLTGPGGVCAVVAPSSIFADTNSTRLRERLMSTLNLEEIVYYPAEARLFRGVDVPFVTFVGRREPWGGSVRLTRMSAEGEVADSAHANLNWDALRLDDFVIPVGFGAEGVEVLESFAHLPRFAEHEHRGHGGLWAGRELDETNAPKRYLASSGRHPFLKGANVERLRIPGQPEVFADETRIALPASTGFPRLVWRDVSRPNQKRRVHATLIPPGWVTGNSLGVAHLRGGKLHQLAALLAVVSSTCFEFQLRAILSTGHVSLSSVRRVRVPRLTAAREAELADITTSVLDGDADAEARLEACAAKAYGLDRSAWQVVLDAFPKLSVQEREAFLGAW